MTECHTTRNTLSIVDDNLCWHLRTNAGTATLKCVDVLDGDESVPARNAPPIPTDVIRTARDNGYTVER